MSYLKIKNIKSKLDTFTLHIENVEIKKGSIFGILGYSGAGKSTLLNLICGLEKQDSGNIFLEEKDITEETLVEARSDPDVQIGRQT